MFGQLVDGLTIDLKAAADSLGGLFARFQLAASQGEDLNDPKEKSATRERARFARIYGFTFEGQYRDLARPTLFLVFNDGVPVTDTLPIAGFSAIPPRFVGGLLMWQYDQSDFSIRLDMDVGPLERILLDAEMGSSGGYAGANVRLRQAGANVRFAGANVKLRGDSSLD